MRVCRAPVIETSAPVSVVDVTGFGLLLTPTLYVACHNFAIRIIPRRPPHAETTPMSGERACDRKSAIG